jgi:hypothetical protein
MAWCIESSMRKCRPANTCCACCTYCTLAARQASGFSDETDNQNDQARLAGRWAYARAAQRIIVESVEPYTVHVHITYRIMFSRTVVKITIIESVGTSIKVSSQPSTWGKLISVTHTHTHTAFNYPEVLFTLPSSELAGGLSGLSGSGYQRHHHASGRTCIPKA